MIKFKKNIKTKPKKTRKKRTIDVPDVKNFIEKSKEPENRNDKYKKYLTYVILFILIVIFIFVIFLQINKSNRNQILQLKSDIEVYRKMINERNKNLKEKKNELEYFYFKDFYYTVTDAKMSQILFLIWKYSAINEINPYHVLSIMSVESAFNPKAVSNMGAYGLMQVHYVSWKIKYNLKKPEELFDIERNIKIGCEIFKLYMDEANGNFGQAAFLYNTGNLGHLEKHRKYVYNVLVLQNKFYKNFQKEKNGIK